MTSGYDTIGENWGFGTHVHGWSCTPTRDMIFYALGVTAAEAGYTKARIAPCLGHLAWARGSVPTPHGHIKVEVNSDLVITDSPVPVELDIEGQPLRTLEPGRHEISSTEGPASARPQPDNELSQLNPAVMSLKQCLINLWKLIIRRNQNDLAR